VPGTHRKHTPIVSRQQQKLFGAVESGSVTLPGLSKQEAAAHLDESKGKKLPKYSHKKGRNKAMGRA
jgi:hypothetical protein